VACESEPQWHRAGDSVALLHGSTPIAWVHHYGSDIVIGRALAHGPRIVVIKRGRTFEFTDRVERIRGKQLRLKRGLVAQVLATGRLTPPATLWEGVWEVPAGAALRVRPADGVVSFAGVSREQMSACTLPVALDRAVQQHLGQCECPVQVEISGGLDSGLVAAVTIQLVALFGLGRHGAV